jgi:SAM-dependent methyltransferase
VNARPDFYFDPALYDASFGAREEDLAFYLGLTRRLEGPLLEIGAGSGRVTLPLARAGVSVVAVDPSRAMLDALEERLRLESPEVAARVQIVQADATALALARPFSLILATFNVVGHFETHDELTRFLRAMHDHLTPGGTLIFDALGPDEDELMANPTEAFELDPIDHPSTGETLEAVEHISYDPESRILTATTTYTSVSSGKSFSVPLRVRQWFPEELRTLTQSAGYSEVTLTKDYSDDTDLAFADMILVRAQR